MIPLLVALGAGLGGVLRYVVTLALDDRWPWGTLLVNVAGSGMVGLSSALALDERAWAWVATGFCGSLTTFSSLAVQAVDQPRARGAAYVATTVIGSIGLCALGWWLGTAIA